MLLTLLALAHPQDLDIWQFVSPQGPIINDLQTATAAGDVDGDGLVDLVYAYGGSQRLVLHLGGPGGDFERHEVIDDDLDLVTEIVIEDLDGDGHTDVATVSRNSQIVTVHLGDGEGGLGPRVQVDASVSQGSALEAVDLDGDGDLDLVAALRGSGVIAGYAQVAPGQFGSRMVLASGVTDVLDVAAADLDADGDPDLVYSTGTGRQVGLIEGLGAGAFAPAAILEVLGSPLEALRLVDLEGDGDLDLVGASDVGVQRFNNQGGQLALGAPLTPSNWDVKDLDVADMDGDGLDDIVLGNVVLTREPGGTYGTQSVVFDPPFFLGLLDITTGSDVIAADLDGDGRRDVVVAGRRYDQTALGVLAERGLFLEPSASGPIVPVDFDLDGDIDLVEAGRRVVGSSLLEDVDVTVWPNEGDGTFGPRTVLLNVLTGLGRTPAVVDLDGDGRVDLFQRRFSGAPRVAMGVPGGFAAPVDVPELTDVVPRFEDIDGDGDLDALTFGFNPRELRVHRNLGGASFGPPEVLLPDVVVLGDLADVNRDGAVDALVALPAFPGSSSERFAVALGDPAAPGTFSSVTSIGGSAQSLGSGAFVDLDGDGNLDVDSARSAPSFATSREVHFGDGTGAFGPTVDLALPGVRLFPAIYADFDGDGHLDIAGGDSTAGSSRTRLAIAPGDGTGAFPSIVSGPDTGGAGTIFWPVDLDSDGDEDILVDAVSGVFTVESMTSIGTPVCAGEVNFTGIPAVLTVTGSPRAPGPLSPRGSMVLTASGVPAGQTVLFVNGTAADSVPGAGGSQGTLCLGGALSRYVGPGEIRFADGAGRARLPLDLSSTPVGNVIQTVTAGQTLLFQAWYRDSNPGPVSNFTGAVEVTYL